ncbi:hypothetical protein CAPTEDRAFT_216620 [Capitella teleta]|uniref:Tesmin/TSO1-like CXC domain-containing protein n=1 Tax=Capitella teleta TaxID=283909 RepID=R7UVL8_CAPTE|nr:hypothetical protein CAPTEDRAFT_216620 [Capitella teleta]|eukprot:ELU07992.1 hypothetical protein CAPTEDRAFT_216620 [Capitella teleta]
MSKRHTLVEIDSTAKLPKISEHYTQASASHPASVHSTCFFCDKPASKKEKLSKALTKEVDLKVREAAESVGDSNLLNKLSAGDMVSIEAKYHPKCQVTLYNHARSAHARSADTQNHASEYEQMHGIAFAELVSYLEDAIQDNSTTVFKLTDLSKFYLARMGHMGQKQDTEFHSTRLKERLLQALPDFTAICHRRDVLMTCKRNLGDALAKASENEDALHIMRASKAIRKDIDYHRKSEFNGSFTSNCQQKSVPSSLLKFVQMVLDGTNDATNSENKASVAAMTISQLIMFNSVKHARKSDINSPRHTRKRETPLPIYISLKIYGAVRNRGLIDTLHELGICVSYQRLLDITNDIASAVCQRFNEEGVVCPPKLRNGLFTTAAVDNIDHNPSSATANGSFHGTAISLMQHPTPSCMGTDRPRIVLGRDVSNGIPDLPYSYAHVAPTSMPSKTFTAPQLTDQPANRNNSILVQAKQTEYKWLKLVSESMKRDQEEPGWICWPAYHASIQKNDVPPAALVAMLPLFYENAHSCAMIKHSMDVIKASVNRLNPGQTPIIAFDQPLFALAKQIQWSYAETHGEDQFVIMFGGLHIEMTLLKILGDWLNESGWTSALVQAGMASPGTANSFIHGSHVSKTRHAHQVTAASLYNLLQEANTDGVDFEEWCTKRCKESNRFSYWHQVLSLQVLLLTFVRAHREGDFDLYVQTLGELLPWCFALDHTHYARWLSVHVRDMMDLQNNHPAIMSEFQTGNFVVQKTRRRFSAIALDHCHEQNNAVIKGSGGAVGLTENPSALKRWIVAGPEITRLITEFEDGERGDQDAQAAQPHHEQRPAVQKKFATEVKALTSVLMEIGNPFNEDTEDLFVLDTKEIVVLSETVKNIGTLGKQQYLTFVKERFEERTKAITDVIPKNKLKLFSRPAAPTPSKHKMQLDMLKRDCGLFSRLYVACQIRDGNLDEFFAHEIQASPPSLAQGGQMRATSKADILTCIYQNDVSTCYPTVDVLILDGAAVVHMLNPGPSTTFQQYVDCIFLPYIVNKISNIKRLDIVWDVYDPHSLKASTRERRGHGVRRRVVLKSRIPKMWKEFLCNDENKSDLFHLLSHAVNSLAPVPGKEIYATLGADVLTTSENISAISPCTHEEADTRVILHLHDAVQKGLKTAMIRTVDTDVVIIAASAFTTIKPAKLWIAFGSGRNFRHLPVHEIVNCLGFSRCSSLPLFHAMTGCDTVSAFYGRGKRTAWETWQSYPEVTEAFQKCVSSDTVSKTCMSLLERFVILLYDKSSKATDVNEARKHIFTQKARSLENIPPTQAALEQHVKRAVLQAKIWNNSTEAVPSAIDPSKWGWVKEGSQWKPLWTSLPEAAKCCYELIHCGCKKGCNGRCKCKKAGLKCTSLCVCGGGC